MRPSLPSTLFIAVLLVVDGQPLLAQEHTLPTRAKKMSQRVTPRLRSMDDFTTLAVQRASLTHDAYRAAAPSTWIFLIGAYRTFYYVRRSVKKFAELSAPGDYAIALVCWDDERLENVKLNKYGWGSKQFNEANVRAAFGGEKTLAARLADDAAFFGGRLIYRAFARRGVLVSGVTWENYAFLNREAFRLARGARAALLAAGAAPAPATEIVVRSRPDVCLERGFDLREVRRRYDAGPAARDHVAYGQLVDGDIFLMTSWDLFERDIAGPLLDPPETPSLDVSIALRNMWQFTRAHLPDPDVNPWAELYPERCAAGTAPCAMRIMEATRAHCLVRFGTALQNRSEMGRPIDGILERPTTRDPAREARCQYPAAIHFRANPRLDKTPPLSRALPGGFGALRDKREDRGITAATCPDAY